VQVFAMWTDPAYRRRGLSRLVLERVVARAEARGLRVKLDVARGNGAARTAYERYGFVATGTCQPLREASSVVCEEMVLPESATRRHRGC
jgi:ribosomal protein S18 acetylase RimI-like enzyme